GRGRSGGKRAMQAYTDDDRPWQIRRLSEHRGLCLDATDAPTENTEAIDHRGVRIRTEERVRHREAVAYLHDSREPLQIHLVADAGTRRHHAECLEGLAGPAQQGVPLAIALVLPLEIALVHVVRAEEIGLYGVVDDEVHRDEGLDASGILSGPLHRGTHGREIDGGRYAGEVLHQDPHRPERNGDGVVAGRISREGGDVLLARAAGVGRAHHLLQQDLHGHWNARQVAELR